MNKTYLVTGGTGFIGSSIVKKLLSLKKNVFVFDNNQRGDVNRLAGLGSKLKFIKGDIRIFKDLNKIPKNIDCILHLAYVNGTENFYTKPYEVLDIGVKGMINILDFAIKNSIKNFVLFSSSEVYQNPKQIPTPEKVEMVIPNVMNPRYCYGGGKIISELMAVNYGKKYFKRLLVIRPHNVYGPDMGNHHVIPQILSKLIFKIKQNNVNLKIQGTGKETRSFIYIDDFVDAFLAILNKGKHLEIYNIGNNDEIKISSLVKIIANKIGINIKINVGKLKLGSPLRRCPSIIKIKKLGYKQKINLSEGLDKVIDWHQSNK
jgi:nucleoside-diphosphate-sugar epimerase